MSSAQPAHGTCPHIKYGGTLCNPTGRQLVQEDQPCQKRHLKESLSEFSSAKSAQSRRHVLPGGHANFGGTNPVNATPKVAVKQHLERRAMLGARIHD